MHNILPGVALKTKPPTKNNIKFEEGSFSSSEGLELYYQVWMALKQPSGVINLVHGFSDHSSRYSEWAQRFAEAGFIVRSYDMRGHGLSEGKKGYCPDYNVLLNDLDIFITRGKQEFPGIPFFIYGHSMGGNLVINYASRNNLDACGLIITSPWLELVKKYSAAEVYFANLVSRIFPGLMISNGLKAEDISRDKQVVSSYRNDDHVFHKINVKLAVETIAAGKRAALSIYKINVPMLVMHGTADRITSFTASENFVRNAGDRTEFVKWVDYYHELHNDTGKDKVFETIVTWIRKYNVKY